MASYSGAGRPGSAPSLDAALSGIVWDRPWLAPYARLGRRVVAGLKRGATLAASLQGVIESERHDPADPSAASAEPRVGFVPAGLRPAEEAYESYIARTAQVPVRDDLHDFFNGLVWLRLPALKLAMAVLHAEQIAVHGASGRRSRLRDAITLLDESGAVWAVPPSLTAAWQERRWDALFDAGEPAWSSQAPWLVGHGLLAQLVHPRKSITAHVWSLPAGSDSCDLPACADALRTFLGAARRPLPVLGVPGWWPANREPGFYNDPQVFRPLPPVRPDAPRRPARA